MLILILIDVQYSQNAAFSFEKGSNCQNHSTSGSHHLVNKSPPPSHKIFDFPPVAVGEGGIYHTTPYSYFENPDPLGGGNYAYFIHMVVLLVLLTHSVPWAAVSGSRTSLNMPVSRYEWLDKFAEFIRQRVI